ncbi:hypothetical protein FMO001_17300 [Moritella sp. F1]|nr:hypothetical protein FMO001_17300 [Moritella sp. F1]
MAMATTLEITNANAINVATTACLALFIEHLNGIFNITNLIITKYRLKIILDISKYPTFKPRLKT